MTPRLSAGRRRCRPVRSTGASRHAVVGSLTIITGEQDVRHLSTCRAAPAFCAKTQNVRRVRGHYLHGRAEGVPEPLVEGFSVLFIQEINYDAWETKLRIYFLQHRRQT